MLRLRGLVSRFSKGVRLILRGHLHSRSVVPTTALIQQSWSRRLWCRHKRHGAIMNRRSAPKYVLRIWNKWSYNKSKGSRNCSNCCHMRIKSRRREVIRALISGIWWRSGKERALLVRRILWRGRKWDLRRSKWGLGKVGWRKLFNQTNWTRLFIPLKMTPIWTAGNKNRLNCPNSLQKTTSKEKNCLKNC